MLASPGRLRRAWVSVSRRPDRGTARRRLLLRRWLHERRAVRGETDAKRQPAAAEIQRRHAADALGVAAARHPAQVGDLLLVSAAERQHEPPGSTERDDLLEPQLRAEDEAVLLDGLHVAGDPGAVGDVGPVRIARVDLQGADADAAEGEGG